MGKIYCIMGRSGSGKDTIYCLLKEKLPDCKNIVPYTTRPIREGEMEGREYHFCGEEKLQALQAQGKVIELRAYHTRHGIWKYFTVDDGQIDPEAADYLLIATPEACVGLRKYFGGDRVEPIYIEVEDGERLSRALARERQQKEPKYAELCRRFLADEEDFSPERLAACGIRKRFENVNLQETVGNILAWIGRS